METLIKTIAQQHTLPLEGSSFLHIGDTTRYGWLGTFRREKRGNENRWIMEYYKGIRHPCSLPWLIRNTLKCGVRFNPEHWYMLAWDTVSRIPLIRAREADNMYFAYESELGMLNRFTTIDGAFEFVEERHHKTLENWEVLQLVDDELIFDFA